jgi:glycosyltransferase involved in cell wall biosynthesis
LCPQKSNLEFSICIPTYNGESYIGETLKSIFNQDFQNYEIIISDDNSTDHTIEVIKSFKDERIKIFKNKENLGYGRNLEVLRKLAKGDILFLMGQDDILGNSALSKTCNAFLLDADVGVVTRPYFWFDEDISHPVRAVKPYDKNKDSEISVFDGRKSIQKIFESVGQLSGLAYRMKYMDIGFHEDIFPAHIYPFASILKNHKVVYLKDYLVAVRIRSSVTRHDSKIYDRSPVESWIQMFETVYSGKEYADLRKQCTNFITSTHFDGLVQLKTSASMKILLREILFLIKYRWRNLFNFKFWLFALGTILVPRRMLRILVDGFKKNVLSKTLKDVKFEF